MQLSSSFNFDSEITLSGTGNFTLAWFGSSFPWHTEAHPLTLYYFKYAS